MAGEDSSDSIIVNVDGDDNKSALFGKYDLGKLLGSGAFAKVYQAEDLHNDRESVAIKVVQKKRLKDGLTAHVKREISVMRRLRHPHIVLLSEVLATKTKIYFVMELAKGGELFSRVSSNRFTEGLSRKYFRQLISAVRYCHARGVYHRDLKPENLLLDENRDLKVSDFGLSAMKEQIKSDGMLHTLCGTPAYVAPELLTKKGYDGSKADIWSCGVVLFLLNAGYLPFRDSNISGLYRRIRNAQYTMPEWTSPELRNLLRNLLEPSPERRITVDEILNDPWFNHGVDPSEIVGIQVDDYDLEESGKKLNAFELIASASTANLAGLFGNFVTPDHCDQFVSDETPAEIMGKVVAVAKQLNLRIAKKKERAVKLEGSQGVANIVVKIRRLTDELVMVEMKNKQRDVGLAWADELRRKLRRIINQPVNRGP
ncbi:CBL-interacting protein kinase 22 [Raphanus sativus]|uniref:non-specific serine/threonine protein kinase n=1 Tax=Raphanus sativus TaxID=3726 RepID=A0A6J0JPC4_RAPSA|nr:CBL-interacting serine/threonine-protein kinase 22-like [Raphanus sativus]KAJ4891920.1 CBL-interacting protein kinase 22 [Raphanus sativus]